ncbi:hypothetical protein EXN61_21905 [Agrobacterium tumefaciens]|uniref:Uncharacterized protein n=1 Tax=Agrobacterium tumefaciens TaxID=358 RepID=A0A546XRZ6_AGRTU|nr:hypothetical protein [Agrobacterium tumefaciens]TRB03513.1 hypothetical protein EXN61_21905 [Agrobacterium tumefaciens]
MRLEGQTRPHVHVTGRAAHHSINDPYRDCPRRFAIRKASRKAFRALDRAAVSVPFPLFWFLAACGGIIGAVHVALRLMPVGA